ncbi:DUF922 domain-containing protein [Paraflavitalea sp. CAU 1676]|uniref:DUF922 domain-containing protein n=1 Tax=Paraflavitalea sp. CAU 1676 TaxID=3032598 RepID=UPI0023DC03B6|nr:DUF922 domain-containing protein [Paraflavitalea sp. CAU 1676]MDF2189197.1 DUF922 domain-containing protein [Paraflavitalea sp. CAU 1676]
MYRSLSILTCLLLAVQGLLAQDTRLIRFKNESPALQLQHYRLTGIKDDRADTGAIGSVKTGLLGKKTVLVALEGGAASAINQYVSLNARQDAAATPVEIHITELSLTEQPAGLRTKIETAVTLAFWVSGKRITDYRGKGEVQTMGDLFRHIEDVIRQNISNSLVEFDGWWGKNKRLYSENAPVSLTVEIARTTNDTSKIIYSPSRPLTVTDFMGPIDDLSKAAAQTASAMTLRYATNYENGEMKLQVIVSAYFDRSRSWFGKRHRTNERILTHEQIHFDITALKVCELADTLKLLQLTRENHQEKLEQVHAQKQRELETLQRLYDTETNHGTLPAVQDHWNRWVKEMLEKKTCYR